MMSLSERSVVVLVLDLVRVLLDSAKLDGGSRNSFPFEHESTFRRRRHGVFMARSRGDSGCEVSPVESFACASLEVPKSS